MGTSAPVKRTTDEPKRVGNPFYRPLRIAPSEKPDEVRPVKSPEKIPA